MTIRLPCFVAPAFPSCPHLQSTNTPSSWSPRRANDMSRRRTPCRLVSQPSDVRRSRFAPARFSATASSVTTPRYSVSSSSSYSTRKSIPLDELRVVIVGAGPAGLCAAAALHTMRFRNITVLERLPAELPVDVSRSYALALSSRAGRLIERLPPPLQAMLRAATPVPDGYCFCAIPTAGPASTYEASKFFGPSFQTSALYFRAALVRTLRDYAVALCTSDGEDAERMRFQYATRVDSVSATRHAGADQRMRVHYTSTGANGEKEPGFIDADLVLACDGVNSSVVPSVSPRSSSSEDGDGEDKALFPFERHLFENASDGQRSRSLLISEAIFAQFEGVPADAIDTHWIRLRGREFDFIALPMLRADRDRLGGTTVLFSFPVDDPFWDIATPDELFARLNDNFPQIDDFRAWVSADAARAFVTGKYTNAPPVSYVTPLARYNDDVGKGGAAVIALGDAAHSVPPTMGEGVNASLEDVAVLWDIIKRQIQSNRHGEKSTSTVPALSLAQLVDEYQQERMSEVKALADIHLAVGFMGKKSTDEPKWQTVVRGLDQLVRMKGRQLAPALVGPVAHVLLANGLPYTEVTRQYRQTTRALIALAVAGVLALFVVASAGAALLRNIAVK